MKRKCQLLFAFLIAALCVTIPQAVHAQFNGYTLPQSVSAVVAPAGTLCTGGAQNFNTSDGIPNFANLGQTQHYAYIKTSGVFNLTMQMFGIDSAGNSYLISDSATQGQVGVGSDAVLTATGYFPNIRISVTCNPTSGSFTLNYTGTSSTTNQNSGAYQLSQLDKLIASNAPAGTNLISAIAQTPLGNALGTISFSYVGGSGPAGSTLVVECLPANGVNPTTFTFTPSTSAGAQFFNVPSFPCVNVAISYIAGGANSNVIDFDYIFLSPGFSLTRNYTHVTGTTATVVKAGPGTLHSLVVGTSAAGTISLFDLAPAACTATPSTNVVSVITEFASGAPPPSAYLYDVLFQNGICLKASAAMDITAGAE